MQVKVDCEPKEHRMEKKTCPYTCWSRENCYYVWYRNYYTWSREYLGCSYGQSVWFYSASSPVTCVVRNKAPIQKCTLDYRFWGVTYTRDGVCALKGSSVDLSCSYKHPEGLRVTRSFWFTEGLSQNGEPQDVRESDQYRGRVQYSRTPNPCTMTITDLRETDTQTYRFRFYTDDPDGRYTGEPGVSLSVTDLKITVSHTGGGGRKLTCSSSCTPSNPTYVWYRNRQPVSDCTSASCSVSVLSEVDTFSCAVKGSGLRSPPVCEQNYSITNISSQCSGPYYCTAQNQLGQNRSGPSRLDVLCSPRTPSVSEAEFNGSVTLVCVSDSNPASSYNWFRKITLCAGLGHVLSYVFTYVNATAWGLLIVPGSTCQWITNFLTGREQQVRLGKQHLRNQDNQHRSSSRLCCPNGSFDCTQTTVPP
ncbi:hypothetical protein NFI96_024508 [Prochilodus magdalenae]|nr:hypothetical protein NFI96_024508 [Prochilodus magdalenae]